MIQGQRALAKVVGVSVRAVGKWIHRGDWPFGTGPWSAAEVEAIRRWRYRTLMDPTNAPAAAAPVSDQEDADENDGTDDPAAELQRMAPEKRAKLALLVERAAKLKVERELMLAGYVRRADVERVAQRQATAVEAELMTARLLVPTLQGKGVEEAEQILEDWARDVCNRFAAAAEPG